MNIDELNSYLERDDNYNRLTHYCSRILPLDAAEDATQEALIKAMNNIDKFDAAKASLRTWLYKIAYHCCIDIYRRTSITTKRAAPIEAAFSLHAHEPNALEQILVSEKEERLDIFLGRISPPRRDAIKAYYYRDEKLSSKKGAKFGNTTVNTIRCRILNGRKDLKREIEQDDYDWRPV